MFQIFDDYGQKAGLWTFNLIKIRYLTIIGDDAQLIFFVKQNKWRFILPYI